MQDWRPVCCWRLVLVSLLVISACAKRGPVDVLVIAPHPDDEVLFAGGVLDAAVRAGQRVSVIVITNGDFGCERDGWARQDETLEALATLGVAERDVRFLGYPDGHLAELGPQPLAPVERRDAQGRCTRGDTTYARRGVRGTDVHTALTGAPARYTEDAVVGDLAALLAKLEPRDVYVPHPIDEHPDHVATYTFFRRALDRLEAGPRRVHRALVHFGDCWPGNDCKSPLAPKAKVEPLPAPLEGYVPSERVPADGNLKLAAIERYRSQLGTRPRTNWLMSFARAEEVFFPEVLERDATSWERRPADGQAATELHLELTAGVSAELATTSPAGTDTYTLTFAAGELELARVDDTQRTVAARWPMHGEAGELRLRVDPRPDEGGHTEWSFWSPRGFIGAAVTAGLVQRIEPR